jgi:hypothetical protein
MIDNQVRSVEKEVSDGVKLNVRDDTSKQLEEDEEPNRSLGLVARFNHSIRHSLECDRVSAWVNCVHLYTINEGESLGCDCLVEIVLLDILPNSFVGDGSAIIISSAEE